MTTGAAGNPFLSNHFSVISDGTGLDVTADNNSSGSVSVLYGVNSAVNCNAGTVSAAYGVFSSADSVGGVITDIAVMEPEANLIRMKVIEPAR